MPAATSYCGLHSIGKIQKGETIFVSAAAGAVGQIAVQLAKREGLKVIGSAGSDEKVEFIKSLGVDVAFNCTSCPLLFPFFSR
jgi:NADPH-dependent curcumin reductase CurA